jgi:hypothetical protein
MKSWRDTRPVSVLAFDRFQQRTAAKGAWPKDKQNYALGLIEYSSASAPSARIRAGGPRWLAIQRDSE